MRKKQLVSAEAVYEHNMKEKKMSLKVGVNNKLDGKVLIKRPVYGLENIANISTGVGITGVLKNEPSIKTGFQLDINI